MRRLQPKSKDRRKVPIPPELRASLMEVFELIQEAKTDRDIRLDFDDAIQVGVVCGGRYGKKPRPYILTYFPRDDSKRGKWELSLHHTDIEDIGAGRMTEITMHCCTAVDCRCKFREADGHCFYCDYCDDPTFGTFTFPAATEQLKNRGIVDIAENSTRESVLATLGSPNESGGDEQSSLGYIWPWILFRCADCQVRFEFGPQERIRNVTILEKDWKPGM